jgi:hypothetical protein
VAIRRAQTLTNGDCEAPRGSFHYDLFILRRPIPDRKLTRLGGKQRLDKEAIMLDTAFVAAAVVFLAMMGVYALALRQL